MRLPALVSVPLTLSAAPLMAQVAVAAPRDATAEPQVAFDRSVAAEAVTALAAQLDEVFVFPEIGTRYAEMLRGNLKSGAYSNFPSAKAFADKVTADLEAIHRDGHLAMLLVPPDARGGPQAEQNGPPSGSSVVKAGWIADGIAYIRFDLFPGNDATLAELRRFIADHKGARALIIDARAHRGGGLAEMDVIFPELFSEEVVLAAMDTREVVDAQGGPGSESKFLRKVSGPAGVVRREHYVVPSQSGALVKTQVILLTSRETGSAAEHLAMALQRTKRATLIGETTVGAGHFGGMVPLDKAFTYAAFIPVGRTFDPTTGQGWEGTGVTPDVAVPAKNALAEALRRLGANVDAEKALAGL